MRSLHRDYKKNTRPINCPICSSIITKRAVIKQHLKDNGGFGCACWNCDAILYVDDEYRVIVLDK